MTIISFFSAKHIQLKEESGNLCMKQKDKYGSW